MKLSNDICTIHKFYENYKTLNVDRTIFNNSYVSNDVSFSMDWANIFKNFIVLIERLDNFYI